MIKKMYKKILYVLAAILLPVLALAAQISVPSAPGSNYGLISTTTGAYVASSTSLLIAGSNITFTGGIPRIFGPSITISATGGGSTFPFTPQSWGNSTTSVLSFPGFISTASSTLSWLGTGGLGINNGLIYNAATTTFNSPLTYSAGAVGCATCLTANQSITLSGVVTGSGATAITTAFGSQTAGVLGNVITGNTAPMATSTLYGVAPAGGYVLGWNNTTNGIGWIATSSAVSGVTSVTGTWPIISSGGLTPTISFGGLSTTSPLAAGGNLLYATGVNTVASVATSTISVGTGLTNSGTLGYQVGGSAASISFAAIAANSLWANQTSGSAVPTAIATSSLFQNSSATLTGLLSSSDWSTFNNKSSFAFPYTPTTSFNTNANSTSTLMLFTAGITASSTTSFGVAGQTLSFIMDSLGRLGFGTASPSALQGITIATSTVFSTTQFGGSIASSTSQAANYTVNWETGNIQRYILNQSTNLIINATSSNPRDGFFYKLLLCQDPTGSRVATFVTPGQLIWTQYGTTSVQQAANTGTWIGMVYDSRVQRYTVLASSTPTDTRVCLP